MHDITPSPSSAPEDYCSLEPWRACNCIPANGIYGYLSIKAVQVANNVDVKVLPVKWQTALMSKFCQLFQVLFSLFTIFCFFVDVLLQAY